MTEELTCLDCIYISRYEICTVDNNRIAFRWRSDRKYKKCKSFVEDKKE